MMMHRQTMHRQMMKIMFAITDADNDGALFLRGDQHDPKRVFDKVDINRRRQGPPERDTGLLPRLGRLRYAG